MSSFTETFNNREAPCVTRETAWSRTHRDLQATAMSVDWSGQWVLLAGRYAVVFGTTRFQNKYNSIHISDGIWPCKNWTSIKWTMTISCASSIEIRSMKFLQPNGPYVRNHRNTVQSPLANWLKSSRGVLAIPHWSIRCEHTRESSPISIGTRRRRICWPAAQLIRSRIYGICVIRKNRWCLWVQFACVSICNHMMLSVWLWIKLDSKHFQRVPHKSASIEFREICWPQHMMAIYAFGTCERVHVPFNT